MGLTSIFKGVNDQFEVTRVVGAFGATAYIIGANAFVAYSTIIKGNPFDLSAYCLSFPTGLGVAVGSIAGSVAIKDRNVAVARQTQAATDAATATNASSQ